MRGWAHRLIVVCALAAWGGGCRKSPPSPERLEDLGRQLGLIFPPGARLVGVERENGMDDLVALKVELPPAELGAFLERSPIKASDMRPGERGMLGPDHDWWDPGGSPRLRTGQANLPAARVLNIGVDDSRPSAAVLYIVNHGT